VLKTKFIFYYIVHYILNAEKYYMTIQDLSHIYVRCRVSSNVNNKLSKTIIKILVFIFFSLRQSIIFEKPTAELLVNFIYVYLHMYMIMYICANYLHIMNIGIIIFIVSCRPDGPVVF
jgi:hypothetical protein